MKTMILGCMVVLVGLMMSRVDAWFRVNAETVVTIEGVADPYWFDLLIPADDAPLRTDDDLQSLLPEGYLAAQYTDALNGFRDADGYVSFRLYYGSHFLYEEQTDVFVFGYDREVPFTYKLAVVHDDGSMTVSDLLTQTKYKAEIVYDLTDCTMTEYEQQTIIVPDIDTGYFGDTVFEKIMISILSLVAVAAVEFGLAYVIGYRKKDSFAIAVGLHCVLALLLFGIIFLKFVASETVFTLILIVFASTESVVESLVFGVRLRERSVAWASLLAALGTIAAFVTMLLVHQLF
jgi:hypothetical protein